MSSFNLKFAHLKIPLRDIQTATNNFAKENIIGEEGFGSIYKAQLLRSGNLIDIVARRLNEKYGQGIKEFQTEIMMLSSLKHQHIVTIVGFCDENGEKIIINKFEPNGSLDQYLSDPVTLTWTQRLHICLGIARALSYIHYDTQRSFNVIHRNLKSSKILLGDMWEAKLSGFGLSIMQPAARRHGIVVDELCGTYGYMDPTYVVSGSVSHKSDVYSFGVLLFEVLSGKIAFIPDNEALLSKLAKFHYENGTLDDFIHPDMHKQMDSQALKIFSKVAYSCLSCQRVQRPNIDRVIFALEEALKLQLARENLLVLKERSQHWERNDLEHLRIKYDAIKLATENFAENYRIGSGGYGVVYKVELEHFDSSAVKDIKQSKLPRRCSTVAIKRIREDKEGEQGFIVEIETLSTCMHRNIVSLLGFCYEHPHMILVYEHVSNGSLDDYLGSGGKMTIFTWMQRIKICIDIARGLDYIHTTTNNKQKIIHRGIKSGNILLGENWEAKIADFGLSKFHPIDHMASTISATKVAGTQVYIDPEYARTGNLKKESDVYSFGVVLFEIMSGTLAYDPIYIDKNEKGIAPIVRQHFENGTIKEMVDPDLLEESNFTLSKGPNQDSLNTFSVIGYKCLNEKQVERPTMKVVIEELVKALNFQKNHKDALRISLEDIRLATQNFSNEIGRGGFGRVYIGEIVRANGPTPIAVKRCDNVGIQRENEFLTEVEILFEYKHENIIDLVGYCNDHNNKILVYEYASNGSLDKHLKDASLAWKQRLKIVVDVAVGLDFLHTCDSPVIHRDIKSANIVLNGDWKAKITDFGLSIITRVNTEFYFGVDDVTGAVGYRDPQYSQRGFLTRESDIYSLGVVLCEIMCGRLAFLQEHGEERRSLGYLFKCAYEEGNVEELVLEGIKNKIVPKSLATYQKILYECLQDDREKRPTSSEVVLQLKKALEFQEDSEMWEVKLPRDYKEIIHMLKSPESYTNISYKDLYHMFLTGILLQKDKLLFSLSNNGERNEMVSATMFSFENNILHNRRMSTQISRFKRVVKIMDISNLHIQIKIKTQFLSPNVIYGAYLVFKFCDPIKTSSNIMYVNLKYQMGSETLHSYFATCENDDWMMIELCRFIPHKKDVRFEVLLESLSRYYCGKVAIYVEGIHFRAITDATLRVPEVDEKLKGVQGVLKSDSDSVQQVSIDCDEITQVQDDAKVKSLEEQSFSLSGANEKKCYMLPAKMVLYNSSGVKCFHWKSLSESRFQEVAELLSHQDFRIKCKIQTQKLSPYTDYACYLVFKLSKLCHGLHCPVKVCDVLHKKNKELKFVFFRSPRLVNVHSNGRVPELREDGLMEVIVWEFNSGNKLSDDRLPMSLKLRCYEGNMYGLTVYGVEFRPV